MLAPASSLRPGTALGPAFGWVRRHPDLSALAVILACGLAARLVMLDRAPVFITKDSVSYFLPGWDLAHGRPYDLELRRPPVYSWFIAGVLRLLGDDLRSIALAQHLLGLLTAAATYGTGRLTFGRGVGFGAGLLTALSGPLLIHEHSIMAETLFTCLAVSGVMLLLWGMRTDRAPLYVLGGLVLGLAALTRLAAQLVVVALPVVLLAQGRARWTVLVASLASGLGLALVTVPWMLSVYADYGVLSTGATVGEPLIFRTIHQDTNFALPDPRLDPYPDPLRNEARRRVLSLAAKRANPSQMVEELQRDLGMSRPAADAALRDAAQEIIAQQPGHYLTSTVRLTADLFLGRHEALNLSWTNRRDRAGEHTQENWQEAARIRHLVRPATPDQRAAYGQVDALVNLFQPSRSSLIIGVLFAIGTLAAGLCRQWRPGLLLSLTAAALVLTSTLFSGAVPRFRYPADPFIHTVSLAGALACFQALRAWATRPRLRAAPLAAEGPAAPQPRPRPS